MEGGEIYPHLKLTQGVAHDLTFENAFFDVVIFGFCLYVVDRSVLLRSISEADRVLKNGGFLIITDFDTMSSYKRPNKHDPNVFSYKQDYASIFLSTSLYFLAEKFSLSHAGEGFHIDPQERVSTFVLYKNYDTEYAKID